MDDAKRWIVTYTRYLKQKRKVYHDGVLELHLSSNKLVLYDDSGKTLDSKFLNKDEVIESGRALTFDTHLVDIGEIEKNFKQLTDLNIQGRDGRIIKKTSVLEQKTKHSSSVENVKVKLQNIGASEKHQNIMHNAGRVNKKSQLDICKVTQSTVRGNKQAGLSSNGELPNQANAAQTRIQEWPALYTTQITQKAKRYHDGILSLSLSGSHGKQVMLYDDSRKLIDSRFLKKNEIVEPGVTLAFVAHLVEIGEAEEPHKPLKDLNIPEREVQSNEKTWMQGQCSRQNLPAENKRLILQPNGTAHNCLAAAKNYEKNELQENEASNSHPNITDNSVTEWHALYTSQLTWKAKKYHDGILQLSCNASHGRQVILKSEDERILSSKYINSSEQLRTGTAYELPNYLVDVGKQRSSQGVALKSSGMNLNSISKKAPGNKLLRDASQILSILKKPSTKDGIDHVESIIEQTCCNRSFDFVQPSVGGILLGQNLHGIKDSKTNAHAVRDDVPNPEEENTTETGTSGIGCDFPQAMTTQEALFPECTNSMDQGHGQNPSPDGSPGIIVSDSGTAAFDISKDEFDMKHIGESVTHLAASVDAPYDLSQQFQRYSMRLSPSSNGICCGNIAPMELSDCLKEDEQVQRNLRFINLQDERGSSHSALQFLEEAKHRSGKQACAGDAAVDSQRLKETVTSVASLNFSGAAEDANNAGREKPNDFKELHDKAADNVDIPSFDLGI